MEVKVRQLGLPEVFSFSSVLKKMKCKDEAISAFFKSKAKAKKAKTEEEVAQINDAFTTELIFIIFENIHLAKEEIYAFISDLTDIKIKDLKDTKKFGIPELKKFIAEINKQGGVAGFFPHQQ